MESASLLAEFEAKVAEFAKFRSFIDKATAQKGKFSQAVVDKIIRDNTEKSMAVVELLVPLSADVDETIARLLGEKTQIADSSDDLRTEVDVLELRRVIGEIDDAEFEARSGGLRTELTDVDGRISALEGELGRLVQANEKWQALGMQAGVLV